MRIGSTDALNISVPRANDKPIVQDTQTKTDSVDSINYAHLSPVEKMELPVSQKVLADAIERANKAISGTTRKFEISVHEKTNNIMVKVIDAETNKVVREVPPEKILDMLAKLWELAGIVVDERR